MAVEELKKQRVSVEQAAKILGVSPQFVRVAMQQGALPIGVCIKMSSVWTYHICPEKLRQYLGYGKTTIEEKIEDI